MSSFLFTEEIPPPPFPSQGLQNSSFSSGELLPLSTHRALKRAGAVERAVTEGSLRYEIIIDLFILSISTYSSYLFTC